MASWMEILTLCLHLIQSEKYLAFLSLYIQL